MNSSGNAASKMLMAWPNFMAPPLSWPRTLKIWSAVRRCTSLSTALAGAPTMRLPRPSVVRPANPTGKRRQPSRSGERTAASAAGPSAHPSLAQRPCRGSGHGVRIVGPGAIRPRRASRRRMRGGTRWAIRTAPRGRDRPRGSWPTVRVSRPSACRSTSAASSSAAAWVVTAVSAGGVRVPVCRCRAASATPATRDPSRRGAGRDTRRMACVQGVRADRCARDPRRSRPARWSTPWWNARSKTVRDGSPHDAMTSSSGSGESRSVAPDCSRMLRVVRMSGVLTASAWNATERSNDGRAEPGRARRGRRAALQRRTASLVALQREASNTAPSERSSARIGTMPVSSSGMVS